MQSIHSTIQSNLKAIAATYRSIFCGEREERKGKHSQIPEPFFILNEIKQYLVLSFIYLAKKGMNSNTPHNEHIFIP